ncbi:putative polygalacturonase [Dorcoceras hygrometricum]|uniref:Putative polygalacturonase n=1 Tax=Dorcoceras hygrometricum TaxID=472368 RepID=A0A2Z7ARE8_9LAMI|nr:putative polygalacturonase [Dorcoceras hygrometricum]
MGSNPSTESNYKTAVNSKNIMQMLCMQPGTTAEGYNQGREPKNSMHISTEICNRICGHDANSRAPAAGQPDASYRKPDASYRKPDATLLTTGTRRNTQNDVAPTNQNATVLPSTNEIKQQLDTNSLPAFT